MSHSAVSGRPGRSSFVVCRRGFALVLAAIGLAGAATAQEAPTAGSADDPAAVRRELERVRVQAHELTQALRLTRADAAAVEARLAAAEATARQMSRQRDQATHQATELRRQLAQARSELAAMRAASGDPAPSTTIERDATSTSTREDLNRLQEQQAGLTRELEAAKAERAAAAARAAELVTQRDQATARTTELETQLDNLQRELMQLRNAAPPAAPADVQRQREDLQHQREQLVNQLQAAEAERADAAHQVAALRRQVEQSHEEAQVLRQQNEQQAALVTQLRADWVAAQSKEDQTNLLTRELELAWEENQRLRSRGDEPATRPRPADEAVAAQVQELQRQLAERDRALRESAARRRDLEVRLAARAPEARSNSETVSSPGAVSPVQRHPPTTTKARPASPRPVADLGRHHVVVPGDTLTRISARYYGTARRWQEIYDANENLLASGAGLQPGQRLRIP